MPQFIAFLLVCSLIAMAFYLIVAYVVPVALLAATIYYGVKWWRKHHQERMRLRELEEKTRNRETELTRQVARLPDNTQFSEAVWSRVNATRNGRQLFEAIQVNLQLGFIVETYRDGLFTVQPDRLRQVMKPPTDLESIGHAQYRDELSEGLARTSAEGLSAAEGIVARSVQGFIDSLPDVAFQPYPMNWDEEQAYKKSALFAVPLIDSLDVPTTINKMVDQINYYSDAERYHLFGYLRGKLAANLAQINPDKHVPPSQHKGSPQEIWDAYVKETPFHDLAKIRLPFVVPPLARFEHMWIVAPPGSGKSTLLSALINGDLDRVVLGECSIVVMESKRDLIDGIRKLARFSPGGDLHGKLVFIDAEDVEWPIALNIFDIGLSEIQKASPRDREALLNAATSLLSYIFGGLLDMDLTGRQATPFYFTIQLLLQIPGANLDTMIQLLRPKGLDKYRQYLARLDKDGRMFFEMKFDAREFEATKSQIVDRLFGIKRIRAISKMFSAQSTKLNLFEEMGSAKVILINAPRSVLQPEGVEMFGRFFLAMIVLAAEKRQLLSSAQRLPCYVYLDEAHDIIARDERITVLLDQARSAKVGMTIAHQRLAQITNPQALNALMGSTAIKFAARLDDSAASALARNMGTTAEFIFKQPQYSYAAYIRTLTDTAVSLKVPYVNFADMPRMTEAEAEEVRNQMRGRYAVHESQLEDEIENLPAVVEPDDDNFVGGYPKGRGSLPDDILSPDFQPPGSTIVIPPGTEVTQRKRKTTTVEETETTIKRDHRLSDW